ncbi:MAG TPA: hypothetical protein VLT79_05425 [Gemmatimonadales bacterium]|nr:hypothetical protein [Gemmatimonadales bacterium]
MPVTRLVTAMLLCCAAGHGVAQQPSSDTTMIFWHGENAQLTDSGKSVMEEYLKQPRKTPMVHIVVLDMGSSKDSMLVSTRLNAIRGFLMRKSVPSSRVSVATRGTGWTTDTAALHVDPTTTWYIVMPPPSADSTATR